MSEAVVIIGGAMGAVAFGAAAVTAHFVRSEGRRGAAVIFALLLVVAYGLFHSADRLELEGTALFYALFGGAVLATVLMGMVGGLLYGLWGGRYPAESPDEGNAA